jgi:hypothetical protein
MRLMAYCEQKSGNKKNADDLLRQSFVSTRVLPWPIISSQSFIPKEMNFQKR